jgi:hypothetical protein
MGWIGQDWLSGVCDDQLDGKMAWLGSVDSGVIELPAGACVTHRVAAVFFCPGDFFVSANISLEVPSLSPLTLPPPSVHACKICIDGKAA